MSCSAGLKQTQSVLAIAAMPSMVDVMQIGPTGHKAESRMVGDRGQDNVGPEDASNILLQFYSLVNSPYIVREW